MADRYENISKSSHRCGIEGNKHSAEPTFGSTDVDLYRVTLQSSRFKTMINTNNDHCQKKTLQPKNK